MVKQDEDDLPNDRTSDHGKTGRKPGAISARTLWTQEEEDALIKGVNKYGTRKRRSLF